MIGRNHKPGQPQHVVYFYTASHPVFGDWLKQDIARYDLRLQPDYRAWDRPVGGSDNASFALRDLLVSYRWASRLSPTFRPLGPIELGQSDRNNQGCFPECLESC